jgi:hypothetical protein
MQQVLSNILFKVKINPSEKSGGFLTLYPGKGFKFQIVSYNFIYNTIGSKIY